MEWLQYFAISRTINAHSREICIATIPCLAVMTIVQSQYDNVDAAADAEKYDG